LAYTVIKGISITIGIAVQMPSNIYPVKQVYSIELYNINGQMFKSARINDSFSDHYKIPLQADHPFVIVVLFDDQNKWYSRKIMINEP